MTDHQPFASVVTPFYNTAPYLAECIESVLRQSYQNWEYVLVDNCSTDGSLEIAESYARRDSRIRVWSNEAFVGQVENYNGALARISPHSRYCKLLEADNWLFPNCLEEKVALAELYPSVGIVGAPFIEGYDPATAYVVGARLEEPTSIMDGSSACRMNILDCEPVFGAPTNVLMRSSLVRARTPFYDVGSRHPDREVCYALLQACDFGYVQQVLAFVRLRKGSNSTHLNALGTFHLYRMVLMHKYGRWLFPAEHDYQCAHKRIEREYFAALIRRLVLSGRRREIWRIHAQTLARCGYSLSWRRVVGMFPRALAWRLRRRLLLSFSRSPTA